MLGNVTKIMIVVMFILAIGAGAFLYFTSGETEEIVPEMTAEEIEEKKEDITNQFNPTEVTEENENEAVGSMEEQEEDLGCEFKLNHDDFFNHEYNQEYYKCYCMECYDSNNEIVIDAEKGDCYCFDENDEVYFVWLYDGKDWNQMPFEQVTDKARVLDNIGGN